MLKAREVKILDGLLPGQVLQRDKTGRGHFTARGVCGGGSGDVTLTICRGVKPLERFSRRRVGTFAGRKFDADVRGIPSGGPYTLEFFAGCETLTVVDVFVGDVWILGGQSNMEGIANMDRAPKPHPMVRAFYSYDEWGIAEEPVTFLEGAVDAVHNPQRFKTRREMLKVKRARVKGVGPALFFARELVEITGVPQGLVPCAHGGTTMDQWSPRKRNEGGKSLYGAMYRRFKKLAQPVRGMLWYQGCSDSQAPDLYTKKMKALVAAVRKDFGQAQLPWFVAQIGKFHPDSDDPIDDGWLSIQEQQRRLPEVIKNLSVVPTIDLQMDDAIHVGAEGQAILGKRLARTACFRCGFKKGARDAIRLGRIRQVPPKDGQPWPDIEVAFENVVGKLSAAGVPSGFRLIRPDGTMSRRLHKTICRKNTVVLEANIDDDPGMRGYRLAYGYEIDAYCNIHDRETMGLCVFAARRIEPLRGARKR